MKTVTKGYLAALIDEMLVRQGSAISDYIDGLPQGRTTGIEAAFVTPLHDLLREQGVAFEREKPQARIGAKQYTAGRRGGRIDAIFTENDKPSAAAEYKAVSMPRCKGGPLFDVGQLASDYLRLSTATGIKQGFVVVFVHGPDVLRLPSAASIWCALHNQFHRDVSRALNTQRMTINDENYDVAHQLNWTQAETGRGVATYAAAVKRGALGAVIIECKDLTCP